jgi:predicted SAM-dependent methyltransferase
MKNFTDQLVNYHNPKSLGNRFRNQRFKIFNQFLEKFDGPIKILDVGGSATFWKNRDFQKSDINVTLLNLNEVEVHDSRFQSVKGDATDLSQFKDNEYDIVFSNSVIEHLYSKENQYKMAREVMRVGKFFFVQTPNKNFIMEAHFVLPFFQFLPKNIQLFILTKTRFSRGKKREVAWAADYIDQLRLISYNELKKMFNPCKIIKEKFFGLNKSYTAHNFNTLTREI